jgi:hypothetical protein
MNSNTAAGLSDVLIVTHDPQTANPVREVLVNEGVAKSVGVLASPSDLLHAIREAAESGSAFLPKLVLVDATLPESTLSLLRTLRTYEVTRTLPIIAMGPLPMKGGSDPFRGLVDGVISLPVTADKVRDALVSAEVPWAGG